MARPRRRFLTTLALIAALAGVMAAPASAFYQRYLGTAILAPGSSAFSNWNRLTYNSASFTAGYNLGTKYGRSDGTSTSWLWSSTGSIFDSRSIAYGRAVCTAGFANPGSMYVDFCDTGNT